MEKKPLNLDLLKGLEGTLLGEVLSTTNEEVADFLKEVGDDPTNTDKKVTDLLPLEAALLLHANTNGKASDKLVEDFNAEVDKLKEQNGNEIPEADREAFIEKRKKVKTEARELKNKVDQLAQLAWASIHGRTGGVESLEIRKGGSVIDITDAEGEVCPGCGKVHDKNGIMHVLEVMLG